MDTSNFLIKNVETSHCGVSINEDTICIDAAMFIY